MSWKQKAAELWKRATCGIGLHKWNQRNELRHDVRDADESRFIGGVTGAIYHCPRCGEWGIVYTYGAEPPFDMLVKVELLSAKTIVRQRAREMGAPHTTEEWVLNMKL